MSHQFPDVSLKTLKPATMTNPAKISEWISIATSGSVVRRAFVTALIVGLALIAINHGGCIFSRHFSLTCLWQSILTVFVPYMVVTVSSVQAIQHQKKSVANS